MNSCIIFGGLGYVGHRWANPAGGEKTVRADCAGRLAPPDSVLPDGMDFIACDVRKPIQPQLPDIRPDWIFNFAAVHREPGHTREEYLTRNLPGARNICAFAEQTGCKNILFHQQHCGLWPDQRADF